MTENFENFLVFRVNSKQGLRDDGTDTDVLLSERWTNGLRLHLPHPSNLSRPFDLEGAGFGAIILVAYVRGRLPSRHRHCRDFLLLPTAVTPVRDGQHVLSSEGFPACDLC